MPRSLVRCASPLAIRPLALSIALAMSASAQAATVQANATYSTDGGPVNALVSGPNSSTVDVLEFTYGGPSTIGIHTYGDASGSFGSRSSGYGVYDVTGQFVINTTVTNTAATAQRASFNFEITPGTLANYIQSNLTAGEYVSAGLTFDIRANGNQVWGSTASLSTNSSGTSFQQSGTNIYTPAVGGGTAPTTYSVDGGHFSVDLGVLNAGESLTLSYALSTFAKGQAPGHPGDVYSVPAQVVTVPERTVYYPGYSYQSWVYDGSGGYGYGGYGGYGSDAGQGGGDVLDAMAMVATIVVDGYGGGYGGGIPDGYEVCSGSLYQTGTGSCQTFSEPGYAYVIAAYTYKLGGGTYEGQPSGSIASSGDPFDIDLNGYKGYSNANVTFTTAVPEPSTYVLMFACLALIGTSMHRRTR